MNNHRNLPCWNHTPFVLTYHPFFFFFAHFYQNQPPTEARLSLSIFLFSYSKSWTWFCDTDQHFKYLWWIWSCDRGNRSPTPLDHGYQTLTWALMAAWLCWWLTSCANNLLSNQNSPSWVAEIPISCGSPMVFSLHLDNPGNSKIIFISKGRMSDGNHFFIKWIRWKVLGRVIPLWNALLDYSFIVNHSIYPQKLPNLSRESSAEAH